MNNHSNLSERAAAETAIALLTTRTVRVLEMAYPHIPYAGPVVTRKQAKAAGLKRYFTGERCVNWHLSEKHTKGGNCYACSKDMDYARSHPPVITEPIPQAPLVGIERRRESKRLANRKIHSTPHGNLNNRIAPVISRCLKGAKAGRSWESLVGYTIHQLRNHLERQFTKGMSWDNRKLWHIDHIIPLSSFKFTTAEDAEFKAAWALTNLRPLWSRANQSKSAKRLNLL